MAKMVGVLAALTLALVVVTAEDTFVISHSSILVKFHPIVKKFSSEMATKLGQSDSLESSVYDIITMTLASQVDELVARANGSINMCCRCAKCTRSCSACGRTCCCSGSGGCSCTSCSSDASDATLELDTVDSASHSVWAAYTKDKLVRELRTVVSTHVPSAKSKCCQCQQCKKYTKACGRPKCCVSGLHCKCKSCPAGNDILQMGSVVDFVSLTPEAEAAVQEVSGLVDRLTTLMAVL